MTNFDRDAKALDDTYAAALAAANGEKKLPKRKSAAAYDFLRWMAGHGWTIDEDLGDNWLVAHEMAKVQGGKVGEKVAFLRQAPRIWHAFYEERATGSATTPYSALNGSLGDVIGSDREMNTYKRLVRKAPRSLSNRFEGVRAAMQQVEND
jgi:hypothetical protein